MRTARLFALAVAGTCTAWLAIASCKSTQGPPPDSSAGPGPHIILASPSASVENAPADVTPAPSSEVPGAIVNPLADSGFSCAPTEPIKSTDPCKSSTDCAPSALCHAPQCIDKLKAPAAPDGGVLCTMNLVCKTADVGRCDCVDGVCALVAK